MRDETPREPVRETPAPDPELPPDPRAPRHYETHPPRLDQPRHRGGGGVALGVIAALGWAVLMVFAGTMAFLGLLGSTEGAISGATFGLALLVVLLGAAGIAALVARGLPKSARGPFWAMSVLCVASVLLMMFGVCGVGQVIRG